MPAIPIHTGAVAEPLVLGRAALPWNVVRTRARQEKAVAGVLEAMSLEVFLPLVKRLRFHGKRKASSLVPLFPGYLFVRAGIEVAYALERSDRVAQVLRVTNQESLDRDLANIREAIARGATLGAERFLRSGVRVLVTTGPFRGIHGVVDRDARDDRLVLQIDVLGRGVELEIERDLLAPAA